jgi:hypothetical protein
MAAPRRGPIGTVLLALLRVLDALRRSSAWESASATAKAGVRFCAEHTGLPALVVAAVLAAVGYRILKKSARFLVEVALLGLALLLFTELGWIRW